MGNASPSAKDIKTSIAPMLSVRNGAKAVEFYKAAFPPHAAKPRRPGASVRTWRVVPHRERERSGGRPVIRGGSESLNLGTC